VYTANNPVNLTDPSGLSALKEFGSLVSKIGVSAIKGIRFLVEGTDSPGFFWQALGTLVSGAFQGMAGYITGVYLAKDKDFNSREFAEAAIMGAVINGANALTDRAIMKENSGRFHKHLIPMVVGFGLIVAVAKFIATGMTNILSNFVSLDPDERENTDDATDEGLLYEAITNMLYGYMRYQQGPGQGRPLNANSLYVKFEPYLSLAVGTWGVYEF
jgi:hypothetical protein